MSIFAKPNKSNKDANHVKGPNQIKDSNSSGKALAKPPRFPASNENSSLKSSSNSNNEVSNNLLIF